MKARMSNEMVQAGHDGYSVVARHNGISVLYEDSGVRQVAYSFGGKTESVFMALATLSTEGSFSYAITRNR